MSIKKIIGSILLLILIIGMTTGFVCIFHFVANYTFGLSILFTLGIYVDTLLLTGLVLLIDNLMTE